MIFKIEGTCISENAPFKCRGEIEIVNRTDKTVYASWKVYDEVGNFIAAVSRNYFMGEGNLTNYDLAKLVIDNILKYRMSRRKIFLEMEIIS
jgi:hypothetical protein